MKLLQAMALLTGNVQMNIDMELRIEVFVIRAVKDSHVGLQS